MKYQILDWNRSQIILLAVENFLTAAKIAAPWMMLLWLMCTCTAMKPPAETPETVATAADPFLNSGWPGSDCRSVGRGAPFVDKTDAALRTEADQQKNMCTIKSGAAANIALRVVGNIMRNLKMVELIQQ